MNTYSKHFKTYRYDDLKYQINNACASRKDLITKLNIFNIFQYIKLLSSKVPSYLLRSLIYRILDFYVPAGVITSHHTMITSYIYMIYRLYIVACSKYFFKFYFSALISKNRIRGQQSFWPVSSFEAVGLVDFLGKFRLRTLRG
jgi:hypothetical protein